MSKPKKQHYVPQCYLREFIDPNTPSGQEHYVWIFKKGERRGRRKAPSNIFVESDLYTIHLKTGEKNYLVEETLSGLESRYAIVFREKIKKYLPLNTEEHITICLFTAAMLLRTLRHKKNVERFYDQIIEHFEAIEKANNLQPLQSERMKEQKLKSHQTTLVQLLPEAAQILLQMKLAFLIAEKPSKFISSDDPCNLFNPDLLGQSFYGPGLGQKNVQVTLPLSPEILLCMSWSNLRGYIQWKTAQVQEANRMIRALSHEYFISHTQKPKRIWFSKYPWHPFLFFAVLKKKLAMWRNLRNVRRK